MAVILLVDNGSRRAAATLQLRQLARCVSEQVGRVVHPVSLQHADDIDPAELAGVPAQTFTAFLAGCLDAGEREFCVVPLFFGASRALTSFIPQQLAVLREQYGEFACHITDVTYPLPEGDARLVVILEELVRDIAADNDMPLQHVVLVDHGSPLPEVTAVRCQIAGELQRLLGGQVQLHQSVMQSPSVTQSERQDELLTQTLQRLIDEGVQEMVVSLMFFLPGRHAGVAGDIERICFDRVASNPGVKILTAPLLGEHPGLVDILASRIRQRS